MIVFFDVFIPLRFSSVRPIGNFQIFEVERFITLRFRQVAGLSMHLYAQCACTCPTRTTHALKRVTTIHEGFLLNQHRTTTMHLKAHHLVSAKRAFARMAQSSSRFIRPWRRWQDPIFSIHSVWRMPKRATAKCVLFSYLHYSHLKHQFLLHGYS